MSVDTLAPASTLRAALLLHPQARTREDGTVEGFCGCGGLATLTPDGRYSCSKGCPDNATTRAYTVETWTSVFATAQNGASAQAAEGATRSTLLPQNGDGPFALSLDDFIAAESDTPPALIGDEDDNLLPAHGLLLLIAKGGKGKTTMMIEQAFHLASGIDWLGFKVDRPLRVLFIENEGPREPFRHKLERFRDHWPHEITGGLFIYDEDWGAARLDEAGFVERLTRFVADHGIDVVIGDPLDTFGMEGVGSPEDTRNMVELLKRAGLFTTVAWELLHHSRKESAADAVDEASGAWGGKPDSMLLLEKLPGNRARLAFPKVRWSRRGERPAYILAFDPDTEAFEVVHEEDEEERDYFAEIVELLRETPSLTEHELARPKEKGGIGANISTVKDTLEKNPDTFVSRNGKEVGRSARATCWNLVAQLSRTAETVETVSDSEGTGSPTVSLSPSYRRQWTGDSPTPPPGGIAPNDRDSSHNAARFDAATEDELATAERVLDEYGKGGDRP